MNDTIKKSSLVTDKKTKRNAYLQSFAGLLCLIFAVYLFFYIANKEEWYKMTSSCGHTLWLGFFLLGTPLMGGAMAFEILALFRHRNILSICFLIVIIVAITAMLITYFNMNSTVSGC